MPKRRASDEPVDSLDVHGPFKWGFNWRGAGVRRYAAWIIAGVLLLAILGLLSWLALAFPDKLFLKTQEAVNKGVSIEHKVDVLQESSFNQAQDLKHLKRDIKLVTTAIISMQAKLEELHAEGSHSYLALDTTAHE